MMKVKCPRCGVEGEVVDGKCSICDLPLKAQPSLLIKFHSMSPVKKTFILIGGLIIVILLVLHSNKSTNHEQINTIEPIPCLVPIEGCLSTNWGDSMETAKQKLSSNGYKIKKIDDSLMEIHLEPIELAGKRARVSILYFYSKGFYKGVVYFQNTNIDEIASLIANKYGPPSDPNPEVLNYYKFKHWEVIIYSWMTNDKCKISLMSLDGAYSGVMLSYESSNVINNDAELAEEIKAKELLSKERQESLEVTKRKKEEERLKDLSKPF